MTDDLKKLSEEATALLPCPWCGGPAFPESPSYGRPKWTVVCDHCAAEGPRHNDESEAIAAWNTRATLAAPEADRGVQGFLNAIMDASPNGEWIAVQYHPNGDWSVAETPVVPEAGRAALEAENKRLREALSAYSKREARAVLGDPSIRVQIVTDAKSVAKAVSSDFNTLDEFADNLRTALTERTAG